MRAALARSQRRQSAAVWPILPGSERKPDGWPGWPSGKRFAVVLTHDVEGPAGLAKCRKLMAIERELGFRSSFNFVPEGGYSVDAALREELIQGGWEVGVHDHRHDGMLYRNSAEFHRGAMVINQYLKRWNAVGFRAGFMFHNLEWLHRLRVEYDASTFDTDPFEPQNDGAGTIFPFWVPGPVRSGVRGDDNGASRDGYAELPYTLVQDSTLYLLLREPTAEVWTTKLDWIARHEGMALVNVHPDYVRFPDEPESQSTFNVDRYRELLLHIRERYPGQYWQPLPREVGSFVRENKTMLARERSIPAPVVQAMAATDKPIWIDLENTPHIPFFKPIIHELESQGYRIVLSARDAYQTVEMAEHYGLKCARIGKHYGKNKIAKVYGLFARAAQLLPFALRHKPCLALNHGSRTQTLLANVLGIPTATIMDYEHTAASPLLRALWEIIPSVVPDGSLVSRKGGGVLKYSGIKEDVYIHDFVLDPSIRSRLGLAESDIVVAVRPPASEAHYHNPEADVLLTHTMQRICDTPGVRAVLLPRNKRQESELREKYPQWFSGGKVIIPAGVVEGLNLIWNSDLVVSGGGTMNREAAALGVPVYSIFRGEIGAVDKQLEAEGRLVLVRNPGEVQSRIRLAARDRSAAAKFGRRKALGEIVGYITDIVSRP